MIEAEKSAFAEKLCSEYQSRIEKYVHLRVSSWHDAEDIASTAMYKAISRCGQFDPKKASLSTWVYAIAHNAVIDYYRERGSRPASSELDETLPDSNLSVEDAMLRSEQLDQLADAIEQLAPRERDIVILRYYSNLELMDIANHVGMSYGNLRVVLSRALKKLRIIMTTMLTDER